MNEKDARIKSWIVIRLTIFLIGIGLNIFYFLKSEEFLLAYFLGFLIGGFGQAAYHQYNKVKGEKS